MADVAVDARGRVRVTRLWCVHDCGLVINPDQVRAQCEGNLVWSLGMVLTDDLRTEGGMSPPGPLRMPRSRAWPIARPSRSS